MNPINWPLIGDHPAWCGPVSELEIPERAIALVEIRGADAVSVVKAVAPIIVAAELRKLALHSREEIGGSFCREDHDLLLRRAAQLDPHAAVNP